MSKGAIKRKYFRPCLRAGFRLFGKSVILSASNRYDTAFDCQAQTFNHAPESFRGRLDFSLSETPQKTNFNEEIEI